MAEAKPQLELLLQRLGDPTVTQTEKYGIVDQLSARVDHEAIDALVRHVEDDRVFDPAGASGQPATFGETRLITVGVECDYLVKRLLFGTGLGFGRVLDVKAWWNKHRHLSMDEILQLAREIDDRPPRGPQR